MRRAPTTLACAVHMTPTKAAADSLVGVGIPREIADRAELHETRRTASGALAMQEVEGVALPAGEPVEFRPGGGHVMLMGLARPLAEGETLSLELRFRRAGPLTIRVPLGEAAGH